jgi:hypothetical protein
MPAQFIEFKRQAGPVTQGCFNIGTGPTAVVVHDVGGHKEDWRGVSEALADNHMVYAVDMLGFGGSSQNGKALKISMPAAAIRALLREGGVLKGKLLKEQNTRPGKGMPRDFTAIQFFLGLAIHFLYPALKPTFRPSAGTLFIAFTPLVGLRRLFAHTRVLLEQRRIHVFLAFSGSLVLGLGLDGHLGICFSNL